MGSSTKAARRVRSLDGAFGLGVAGATVVLVIAGAGGWLMLDDWMLLGSRRDVLAHDGVADYLLRSHNDHLMAGVVLWHHLVAAVFGLGSYLPWMITIALAHAAVAVVVRQLLLRLEVRRPLASALAVLLMLWGPATGVLLWSMDAPFAVATGLWVGQLLLVWHAGQVGRRDALGALVGLAAVSTHSVAVLGLVIIVGMLLAMRRWRPALVAAAPLVPYTLWFATIRQQGPVYLDVPAFPRSAAGSSSVSNQFGFVRTLWSTPLSGLLPGALALALLGLAVAIVWRRDGRGGDPRRPVLAAIFAFGLAFAVTTARTRAFAGADYAGEYRYVYVATVLALPFVALGLQHLADAVSARWDRQWGIAVLLVAVIGLATANGRSLVEERRGYRLFMDATRHQVLALAAQPRLAELPAVTRVGGLTWDLDVGHVRRLIALGLLPTDAAIDPSVLASEWDRIVREGAEQAERGQDDDA